MIKNLSFLFGLIMLNLLSFNAKAVDVSFRVDMSNETVSPDGVHVAGSFNGWSTTDSPMTHLGNDLYEIVVDIATGEDVEYKFINGNAWSGEENVPAACGVDNGQGGYNRFLNVPAQDTVLANVCFGSCEPCGQAVQLTISVDMANEDVSPDGVHVAGSFQGWDPAATPMANTSGDVYEVTVDVMSGTQIQYKFINGADWAGEETVPADCGIDNGQGGYNRYLDVTSQTTATGLVCFAECAPCASPVQLTISVDMANEEISPDGVHVAGSFQGWDPAATPMINTVDDVYEVTVEVMSNTQVQYKFINGADWEGEETVPAECGVDNGQGGYNRFFDVADQNAEAELVCYGSCEECPPPPLEVDVTFQVDMANEEVSPDGVFIAGTFNGWTPSELQMGNTSENIYAYTITLNAAASHEYKFINGIGWDGAELVPEACAQNGNRFMLVPDVDTTTNLVCFGMCTECPPPPPEVTVTFIVDMAEQEVSPDGVHLAGSFNAWNTEDLTMINTGGTVYEADVTIVAGTEITYKFLNGITVDDYELVPEECGVNDGSGIFNRFYTVPETEIAMDTVCFGACAPCGGVTNPVNVTFRVDMANEIISENGLHITGNFSDWNPAANEMTNTFEDVYEFTASILEGTYIEYKFVNGDDDAGFESVPAACAQNENRFLTIPSADTVLQLVCFGSCDSCPQQNTVVVSFRVDMSETEVSPDGIHLAADFQGWDPAATEMTLTANNIYEVSIPLGTRTAYEYKFVNGNSWEGAEEVPAECSFNQNRLLNVGANDTTLKAYCFGSCTTCQAAADSVMVTFTVDMSKEEISGYGVHLAGSFQNWNPAVTPMAVVSGTDLYTVSFRLPVGSYQEYKFINGNIWGDDEQVPGDCAVNGNRFFTVPDEDLQLDAFCYGSCSPCSVSIKDLFNAGNYMLSPQPNPASNQAEINIGLAKEQAVILELFDMTGAPVGVIQNARLAEGKHKITVSLEQYGSGIYYFRLWLPESAYEASQKLIVY